MDDLATPSASNAARISAEFKERLATSLFHLYEIAELNHSTSFKKNITDFIYGITGAEPYFWLVCAVNRRLTDLYHRDTVGEYYWKILLDLSSRSKTEQLVLNPFKMSPLECRLFNHYAFEFGSYPSTQVAGLSCAELKMAERTIGRALRAAQLNVPGLFSEINAYVNCFLVYNSNKIASGSTFSLAKCIYFQSPKDDGLSAELEVLDLIIHETAHMHLHLLSSSDELVLNPVDQTFTSPFRRDSRPMIGVFHAHFVLYRLILLLADEGIRKHYSDIAEELDNRREIYMSLIRHSFQEIDRYAELTTLGSSIYEQTRSFVDKLSP